MIATYHWCLTLCIAFIRCNTLISCFFCFQYYHVLKRKKVRMIFFCNLFSILSVCFIPGIQFSYIPGYGTINGDIQISFASDCSVISFTMASYQASNCCSSRLFPVFIITPTSLHPIRMLTTSGRFKMHSFSNIRFTP